jgi:hypothetical protein
VEGLKRHLNTLKAIGLGLGGRMTAIGAEPSSTALSMCGRSPPKNETARAVGSARDGWMD